MSVTFIHTSDWHLGKQFRGMFGDSDAGAKLREARFKVVEKIARLASDNHAAAVLVAGDAFDSNDILSDAIHTAIARMESYAGPWVFLPGNHDCAEPGSVLPRLEKERSKAKADIRVALHKEPLLLADGKLAVLPAPLRHRQEREDVTLWFDDAKTPPDAVRVGLAHGQIQSSGGTHGDSGATNPITGDRVKSARLDYFALGDRHGAHEIDIRTWYSGTPEPDRFDIAPGAALVVTIDAPGTLPHVRKESSAEYTWQRKSINVHSAADLKAMEATLDGIESPDRCILRLGLDGTLGLADMKHLEDLKNRLHGRFCALLADMDSVSSAPTKAEIDKLCDVDGYAGVAARLLRDLSEAGGNGEMSPDIGESELREIMEECAPGAELTARRALLQFYLLHREHSE